MYQRILVPVDGSNTSQSGLLEAVNLARSQGAHLKLLHVLDEHIYATDYGVGTCGGVISESVREEGKQVVLNAAILVRKFGIEPELSAVECGIGSIAAAIVAQANEWPADLIVMGTHGRHGLKRLAMGSQAEDVVRRTHIPVLLVHNDSTDTLEIPPPGIEAVASRHAVPA